MSKPGQRRSSENGFEPAIRKAVSVLKGSSRALNAKNISQRAVRDLDGIGHEYLRKYIEALPPQKRAELGVQE